MTAHQDSITASTVLNAQTKRKGLCSPNQLTSEKLKILISTPIISIVRRLRVTAAFRRRNTIMLINPCLVGLMPPSDQVQQRGRLRRLQPAESRYAGPRQSAAIGSARPHFMCPTRILEADGGKRAWFRMQQLRSGCRR